MDALYFTALNKDTKQMEVISRKKWLEPETKHFYHSFHPFTNLDDAACHAMNYNKYICRES